MDGINFNQLEHLQAKYEGTGHSDTTKKEWLETQHKDTAASFLGHANLLTFISVATGECTARTKLNILEGMLMPLTRSTSVMDPPFDSSFEQIPTEEDEKVVETIKEDTTITASNKDGEEDMAMD